MINAHADLARYLGVSRAIVTKVLKRLISNQVDFSVPRQYAEITSKNSRRNRNRA
jgi:Mn-dependent DtxR family transcriptional regulator